MGSGPSPKAKPEPAKMEMRLGRNPVAAALKVRARGISERRGDPVFFTSLVLTALKDASLYWQ
ncbi:hypothetical protein BDBG_03312 [Blastomyces gilchristii SLH14081]|uniref:Uncharacterized protein n=1 Tax=Blastomyces gilchristii (strain SLH14081) TaxID=559298 RepID=A0A179UJ98_BLAGS|nr:uncharacterized protein BDBG_03312 [Blastomyces gilchristii SLH14081]EQL31566.1 hypothetical protein BDFG_06141 [Blastomyces dermatitidis ATCC 26199]OAT07227.1 hypothetical protein BDBG_03312 [Blastomyces gilchristii SLH14081]